MTEYKKTISKILRNGSYISILASLVTGSAMADVGLPYIGMKAKNCKVKAIDTVLDGGYLTDENCNTLYVRPPKYGEARLTAYSPTTNLRKCERINASNAAQLGNIKLVQEYSKKQLDLKNEILEGVATGQSIEDAKNKLKEVNELLTIFNNSVVSQDEAIEDANSRYGGPVMITLAYHWAEIIEQYRVSNPGFKAVKPLPITKGYLTHQMKRSDENAVTLGEQPVIKIHKSGLPLQTSKPGSTDDSDDNFNNLLTGSPATEEATSTLMEGSANLGIELSLLGLCPYTDLESSEMFDGTASKSPVAYLTPNFTYYYPVASKSIYKVSINPASIGDAVVELRKKGKGVVESMDLANVLAAKDSEIFTEVSTGDLGGTDGVSPEAKKQAKKHLLDYIANTVLRSVGTLVDTLSRSSDYRDHWTETRRGRRSCGFLGLSRCSYSYQVKKSKPNWNKIAKAIEGQINTSRSASSETQRTYQIPGTMAFVPPEQLPKLEEKYQIRKKEHQSRQLNVEKIRSTK